MSIEFYFRIIGMLVLAFFGGFWGAQVAYMTRGNGRDFVALFGLVGALSGIILTPYFTTRPARAIRAMLGRMARAGRVVK